MTAIKLENISFKYTTDENDLIFNCMDISIPKGEITSILGVSGIGKSTLLQLCTGFLTPDNGTVKIHGKTVGSQDWDDQRTEMGIVFQFPEQQIFEDTVRLDILFGLQCRNIKRSDTELIIDNSLESVGLNTELYKNRSPWNLSAGEKRKSAIAGIIALEPKILFMDEPTLGLDHGGIENIIRIVKKQAKLDVTVVVVSHNLDFVYGVSDNIIVLDQTGASFSGSKNEFFKDVKSVEKHGLIPPDIMLMKEELSSKYGVNIDGVESLDEIFNVLENNPTE